MAEPTLDALLDRCVLAYRRGELVPFLGSGMSVPTCPDWKGFVEALEDEAGLEQSDDLHALPRRADRAVKRLHRAGRLAEACRKALGLDRSNGAAPPQTKALARMEWPLVITTNWDDLYANAAKTPPHVLGRSNADCQRILAALSSVAPPIVWALQGALQCTKHPRSRNLEQEIVVGHAQYQRVINAEPHFRRAFAEVARKRSLLFLGSGLREDYLMSLFGEILHAFGGGPLPHFALMRRGENGVDRDFLRTRLNVTLFEYDDHQDLPRILDRLADRIEAVLDDRGARQEERFILDPRKPAYLTLSRAPLPEGAPRIDEKDLRRIADRTARILEHASAQGSSEAHAAAPENGGGWPPGFALIEMLRGARKQAKTSVNSASFVIHLRDPSLLLALWSGRLNVDEVLACEDLRFWVEVDPNDGSGQIERVLLIERGDTTLGSVAETLGIPREGWSVETWPQPHPERGLLCANDVWSTSLEDLGVVADSTLRFTPERC